MYMEIACGCFSARFVGVKFKPRKESNPQNRQSPNPQTSVPPPIWFRGGAHSLAGEGWGSPNSDEVAYTVVFFIYTYFVAQSNGTRNLGVAVLQCICVQLKGLYRNSQ
jgi:hypothetical protein